MRFFGAALRAYSYLYHSILALFLFGIALVALLSGHHNLKMGMLPWSGEQLTYWLLGLSLAGLASVALAVMGRLRALFVVWALAALIVMVKGFFLSNYTFGGPESAKRAVWLTIGALLAFAGCVVPGRPSTFKKKF